MKIWYCQLISFFIFGRYRSHEVQLYAIIIEQFLRSWRLGQLYHGIKGWRQNFRPKANIFGILLWRFKILRLIEENAYIKKYRTLQQRTHKMGFWCYSNLSMHFCINVMKIENHHNKNPNIFALNIFGLKCYLYP